MSGLDRALEALIAGQWILTLEDDGNGNEKIVARRPVGWTGPGDPYERLVADDHAAMHRLLTRRHESEDTTPTLRGIGRQFPTLGGVMGE
ncbi:hypothetical protein [Nocardiopsis algeriensis]|uniref:Uncharacterized protein n=1 Tax=Nocardiopsis algeriensis TaxID=1478215 RepID=A0A841IZD5_9ACTN|nr:hypothetical protein [Nocardiopsis algeriensis]MBB6121815.1 hypothetical protein [Nocardiopsis algeriensis]